MPLSHIHKDTPEVDITHLVEWDNEVKINTVNCVPCVPPTILESTKVKTHEPPSWNNRITIKPKFTQLEPTSKVPVPSTFPWLNIDYVKTLHSLPQYASKRNKNKIVGIVGAGLSGIVSAFELLKLGYDVKVYEISNRIGGRIYT